MFGDDFYIHIRSSNIVILNVGLENHVQHAHKCILILHILKTLDYVKLVVSY